MDMFNINMIQDYLIDLDPGKYQMIYWHDEGPENMSFNDKLEFVKESIYNYWGESNFIEQFPGLEDKLEALYDEDNPDVYWNAFEEHMKDNLDKNYEMIKGMINNSYPDGERMLVLVMSTGVHKTTQLLMLVVLQLLTFRNNSNEELAEESNAGSNENSNDESNYNSNENPESYSGLKKFREN